MADFTVEIRHFLAVWQNSIHAEMQNTWGTVYNTGIISHSFENQSLLGLDAAVILHHECHTSVFRTGTDPSIHPVDATGEFILK